VRSDGVKPALAGVRARRVQRLRCDAELDRSICPAPPEERMAKLRKSEVRDRMRRDVGAWTGTGGQADTVANWAKMRGVEVRQPRNYQYEGLTIAELAAVTGKHPMDAMLDLALDEELRTEFSPHPTHGT